jgi:outer membrane lipoprotein-sorting protein
MMLTPITRRNFLASLGAASALWLGASVELAARSIDMNDDQSAAVREIADFINGYKNLQGEFTQVGPTGRVSKGIFYLSKPGKMRFEYAAPNPFVIVSDGSWVVVKNRAKDKSDEYPLSQTPLRLVLSNKIDLFDETNILNVEQADGLTTVTLEDRKKLMPGQLILVFDQKNKALQQWVVVDGKGRRTTVRLEKLEAGIAPDPQLFKVEVRRVGNKANQNR